MPDDFFTALDKKLKEIQESVPPVFQLSCDMEGCDVATQGPDPVELLEQAEAAGWLISDEGEERQFCTSCALECLEAAIVPDYKQPIPATKK
jgi:hypothetical protein